MLSFLTAQCGTVRFLPRMQTLNSGLVKITATLRVTSTLNGEVESEDFKSRKSSD